MRLRHYLTQPHLAVVAIFALLGPAFGLLTALLINAPNLPTDLDGNLLFITLALAYGFGVMPALLAGLLYTTAWNIRSYFPRLTATQFGVLLDAVAGLIAFAAVAGLASSKGILEDIVFYSLPLSAGAACGGLVAREREQRNSRIEDQLRNGS
ncbi:hypothetical protein [Massilia sp. YIM B02443]|uniref:hypothetical protein n=1 Tax=Massilia sp. YIM B02443 TaxID=3050127 RepID=UPI0025B68A17|nr:hypothetical protein [Massilia sp. YIM B02443]MDN4039911.1 hypothetical protein [Massilia sp. YIM B02443]